MNERLIQKAFYLSLFTIVYNLVEGSISVFFGLEDETLALLGFGVDSFVEVISGLGIAHMILRMKRNPVSSRDAFERTALKITGIAFYILTIGLLAGAVLNVIYQTEPETTLPGIIVSSISIATMYYLMKSKLKVGKELNSDAIIADANCTKTCFNLSIILLGASLFYELTGIAYFDVIGSLGIAYFAFKEGKESFEKSNSNSLACSCDH
ncbi:MAG: hypothetical protein K9N07_11310 [Candidatus Cloacimonetes bacterium]|nr:hypothetical protein [Candidatus Cloacimonadota bacterium]MCF8259340.1 hypothetical protein [Melioribacteraceae bacterium]MCF8263924.1 hypothetical protein [Melioribacteraceae bacterium]